MRGRRHLCLPLLLCLGLAACTDLLFQPLEPHLRDPEQIGLAYRDVAFETADGLRLHGWFLPADPARDTRCTVLFLHGNAENISTHIGSVWWLPGQGVSVFLFDYRGYGRSEGEPSLGGLHEDAQAALRALFAMEGVNGVVVFGQSLGGSVAISALAASPFKERVRALVVEGAFSGYRRIAREKLAGFFLTWPLQWPLSLLIDGSYRPLEAITEIAPTPVLVIHGAADEIVPPHHGEALYAAAQEPKDLWLLPGVGHIAGFDADDQRRRLLRYLSLCEEEADTPSG